jgi:hypothetical protein
MARQTTPNRAKSRQTAPLGPLCDWDKKLRQSEWLALMVHVVHVAHGPKDGPNGATMGHF